MRQLTKRLTALALALVLTLSLGASAWATEAAAPTTEDMETATITINDVNNGDTAVVYQLVKYIDKYTNYEYEENFEKFLKEKAGADYQGDIGSYFAGERDRATKLIEEFVGLCNTSKENGGYAATLSQYGEKLTASDGVMSVALEPGYYLIVPETILANSKIYQPITVFVRVDAGKLEVYAGGSHTGQTVTAGQVIPVSAKSESGPKIEKRVWCKTHEKWAVTADGGVGQTMDFYVEIALPKYGNISQLKLTVNDKMVGLKYVDGSAGVYEKEPVIKSGDGENVSADTPLDGAVKTVTQDGSVLKFELDYDRVVHNDGTAAVSAKTVWLHYQATVTDDAIGEHKATNTASLTYSNAATANEQTTEEKTTTVYNYSFELRKFSEDNESLTGAEFSIYKKSDKADEADKEKIVSFVPVQGKTGVYRPAHPDEMTGENVVTKLPADFTLVGLSTGECYLEEVVVPTGYFAPAGMFKLTLVFGTGATDDHTGYLNASVDGTTSFSAVNDKDSALIQRRATGSGPDAYIYKVDLKNSTTPVLPSTGGVGTVAFTVAGIAIMVAAAFLVLRRKNKER